ncbi:MAG: 4Fe-4S dicluster domain-containing protein [Planctomycetes bacterium]|nr:4Fe-4S dicluster domain-containing protein [Planctomycetota bacterium]
MNRREFIKTTGILTGAAFISSCKGKEDGQGILPGIAGVSDGIPGQPVLYNTTCTECPANCGVSVKVINGCAVKLEGIPGHPINDGALCARGQASLTRLYQPGNNRIEGPLAKDAKGNSAHVTWDEAFGRINQKLKEFSAKGLKNVFLSGRTTGSFSEMIKLFCEKTGVERLPEFEVYSHSTIRHANKMLFGRYEIPAYKIEQSDFLLTFGSDILETFISPVHYSQQLVNAKKQDNFKWCHAEPHVSLTGARADRRVVINPGSEPYLLTFLLKTVKPKTAGLPAEFLNALPDLSVEQVCGKTGITPGALEYLSNCFETAERPLVITGGVSVSQPSGLQAAVLTGLLQWHIGAIDYTVSFAEAENYANTGTILNVKKLSQRLADGGIGVMFVCGVEMPPYALSADFYFNISKAGLSVGLTELKDDFSSGYDYNLSVAHAFETWGDAVPSNGLVTVIQPAVQRIHDSMSEGDILSALMRKSGVTDVPVDFHDFLLKQWKEKYGDAAVEEITSKGYLKTAVETVKTEINADSVKKFLTELKLSEPMQKPSIIITPSVRTYVGRSSILSLLSEIPDPLTAVSYGEWISISEKDAKTNGMIDGMEALIPGIFEKSGSEPVKIQPGLADGIYMIEKDAFFRMRLRNRIPAMLKYDEITGEILWNLNLVKSKIIASGKQMSLPVLSGSFSEHGRGIASGHGPKPHKTRDASMYPPHEHKDYRWAMAIDLKLCSGCSACVAACYIENNIPVAGKEEHLKGREMSWLRIEPFYDEKGNVKFIPMMCQQCDSAPCEPVCPVYATYHTPEGLNAQIYNRCVGTRYCSNNCPYKVRRFNWFKHDSEKPLDKMRNPGVSVRTSGMMEKCTFCIQRIRTAHDVAKDENRKIRDNEVLPACAQTCPMKAIAFGNILDKNSQVYKRASSSRAYRVFEELGTGPAVYYLS